MDKPRGLSLDGRTRVELFGGLSNRFVEDEDSHVELAGASTQVQAPRQAVSGIAPKDPPTPGDHPGLGAQVADERQRSI